MRQVQIFSDVPFQVSGGPVLPIYRRTVNVSDVFEQGDQLIITFNYEYETQKVVEFFNECRKRNARTTTPTIVDLLEERSYKVSMISHIPPTTIQCQIFKRDSRIGGHVHDI